MDFIKRAPGKYSAYRGDFCIALIRSREKGVWRITAALPSCQVATRFKSLRAAKRYILDREAEYEKRHEEAVRYLTEKRQGRIPTLTDETKKAPRKEPNSP